MALNPAGTTSYNWNHKRPEKDGYSTELWGTVVCMQEVQAREYNPAGNQPGRPKFWPDGNPIWDIRIGFATPDGFKTMQFMEAGKKQRSGEKPSIHMQLFELSGGQMTNLIGQTVHIWTWPAHPETGQPWGQGNPRLYGVELVQDAHYELPENFNIPNEYKVEKLLCDDGAHGGQVQQQPQYQQAPAMQGQYYAPPQPQYAPQQYAPQQYAPQPQYQQPVPPAPQMMQQAPAMQTMPPQTATAPMPQGMDPAVAQAMQAVGAVNVQEVDETGGIYDEDVPF